MFRPEGSIDFFARNEYKRRERERTKEHETDSPRRRLHCSVLRHNAKPMSFIPFYPPRFRWKTRKRKNVFEGRQWRERELSGGANYRALSTLIDRYPSGGEVWINGRERMVGASAGKGLGDRSGNAFDGGRMKEQSGIVNGSRSSTLATAFVATRDRWAQPICDPTFFHSFFSHFLELHRIECFETEERE